MGWHCTDGKRGMDKHDINSPGALVHGLMATVVWGTPSPLSLSHIMLQGSSRFGQDSDYYADWTHALLSCVRRVDGGLDMQPAV